MSTFHNFINWIYAYCTDFIINLANLIGLSYYEVNFFIFCLLFPLLFTGLLILVYLQKRQLKRLRPK